MNFIFTEYHYCYLCKSPLHTDFFKKTKYYYCDDCDFSIEFYAEQVTFLRYHVFYGSKDYIIICRSGMRDDVFIDNDTYTLLYNCRRKNKEFYNVDAMMTLSHCILPESLEYNDLKKLADRLLDLMVYS